MCWFKQFQTIRKPSKQENPINSPEIYKGSPRLKRTKNRFSQKLCNARFHCVAELYASLSSKKICSQLNSRWHGGLSSTAAFSKLTTCKSSLQRVPRVPRNSWLPFWGSQKVPNSINSCRDAVKWNGIRRLCFYLCPFVSLSVCLLFCPPPNYSENHERISTKFWTSERGPSNNGRRSATPPLLPHFFTHVMLFFSDIAIFYYHSPGDSTIME